MKKINSFFLFFVFFVLSSTNLFAQDSLSTDTEKLFRKSSFIPIPIAFYTPETRFGGGGAMMYAFRFRGQSDEQRPSQFQFGLAYTQEKQVLVYFPFQIFSKEEKYNIYGEMGYYRYVFQLFGTGNETLKENKEPYDAKFPRLRLNALRLVRPNLYAGIRYWFDDFRITGVEAGGFLGEKSFIGSDGGIISGVGPVLTFDSRDNIFYPTKGYLVQMELFRNAPALGSDFDFTRLSLDAAAYYSVGKKSVFATNIFMVQNYGAPPFQQLALIGGTKKMRGYFEGRFRDRKLWMLQAEYRAPLFWRMGWVAFGGMGNVAHTTSDLFSQEVHYTFGAGLRIRLTNDDPINLRFDIGINEQGGAYPYLTVTEAF